MAEIIYQIPGFEKGYVQSVCSSDEAGAIYLAAQTVNDLLNKWNTNAAFFSLSSHSEALQELVKADSCFARLFTVNQKNHNLQVIIRKAKGMVNRKSVRAIVIEGLSELDATGKRWLEQLAKSTQTSIIVISYEQE